jgi:hypothetical protein
METAGNGAAADMTRRAVVEFLTLLFVAICASSEVEAASIYDMDIVGRLQLGGTQAREMQKILSTSRARRNRIFKKHGIDPNAKPKMSLLQRASSELLANAARERAAAREILTAKQLRHYDALIREIRQRVMASF